MPYIIQLQQVDNIADAGLKLGLRLGLLQTLQSVRSTYHHHHDDEHPHTLITTDMSA
jgi:hypothetical protein